MNVWEDFCIKKQHNYSGLRYGLCRLHLYPYPSCFGDHCMLMNNQNNSSSDIFKNKNVLWFDMKDCFKSLTLVHRARHQRTIPTVTTRQKWAAEMAPISWIRGRSSRWPPAELYRNVAICLWPNLTTQCLK